jgi:hypothetical protein
MCSRLFTLGELEKLKPEQLAILKDLIQEELRNSPAITKILSGKARPIYEKWVKKESARRARPAKRKRK